MSNYKEMQLLINSFAGQNKIITAPKIFVELTGDFNTAILLNEIIFWSDKTTRKDGLFYKTYTDWEDELMLTEYQVRRSIKVLKNMGIVDTEVKRANGSPTTHYRYNGEVLSEWILKKLAVGTHSKETQGSNQNKLKEPHQRNSSNYTKETQGSITVDHTVNHTLNNNTVYEQKPEKPKKRALSTKDFNLFWESYPRKIAKGKAREIFKRKIKDKETLDLILEDLKDREYFAGWDEQRFIPYPTTYLNQERWNDEYELKKAKVKEEDTKEYNAMKPQNDTADDFDWEAFNEAWEKTKKEEEN